MSVIGIIPARSGSKRLPGKNIKPLLGRPLLYWTALAARCPFLDRLVVSTDSPEIGHYADSIGLSVISRPAELAQDDTPTLPVIQHALREAEDTLDLTIYPWVMILQPTSPLRTAYDIEMAVDMAHNYVSSVISVTATSELGAVGGATFKTNGAIYLVNRHTLLRGELYGPNPKLYLMPPERSIDIDTEDDFAAAKAILTKREIEIEGWRT